MKIVDLGSLEAPVLLFGGPYSNLQATQALRDWADAQGIPPRQIICTGDVVAYCANPVETVAVIRDWGVPVVAGNCEKQLASGAQDCGCGFEEGTACDRLSAGWFAYASDAVGPKDRQWMAACPDVVTFELQSARFAVLHGGITDISRFLFKDSLSEAFAEEIAALQARIGPVDAVIGGHCGIPFEKDVGGVWWLNAGVIGMPANDSDARTRFALVQGMRRAKFHRLDYPHHVAAQAMRHAGLVQGYDAALSSGWWPSEDVLPFSMRRQPSLASG